MGRKYSYQKVMVLLDNDMNETHQSTAQRKIQSIREGFDDKRADALFHQIGQIWKLFNGK